MRGRIAWISLLIAAALCGCTSRTATIASDRFALLPASSARDLLDQCSRSVPMMEGTWPPADVQVAQLEADLKQLVGHKAAGCCIRGARLQDVDSYFRQYVGIVVHGRNVIYINAFPSSTFDDWPPQVALPDVRREPFKACDGGAAFWGAIYDPQTRRFSELAFNGLG